MLHNYETVYKNVTLRPLEISDIEQLRKWRNNPSNTRYLSKISYITPGMQKNWFESYIHNDDELCFAIIENQLLNRLVGSLSLYEFSQISCVFGKLLVGDEEAHGKNVGLNATIAAISIAFMQLRMRRVDLHVFADNIAAVNVYKRAGFLISEKRLNKNGTIEYMMTKENKMGSGGNVYA